MSIVSEYVQLTKRGDRYWGLCPFHTEKSPSFTVSPDRGGYYCFGCQKGGSVFNFVMEMEKIPFPEAVRFIAEKSGMRIELGESGPDDEATRKRVALLELLRRVSGSFQFLLTESASGLAAREYLRSRSVADETIAAFGIGYAPPDADWLHGFLRGKGYSDQFLADSGLFSRRYATRCLFADRVMFPIRNRSGEVIAFGGRALTDRGPKYLNSPDTALFHKGDELYGLDRAFAAIRASGEFVAVEGYMDVMALHQAGETRAVAPLGTALTEHHIRLLRRYAARARLLFDSDDAGATAIERAAILCEKEGILCEVVQISDAKDPSELLQNAGPEVLNKNLEYTISTLDFLLTRAMRRHDAADPQGKEFVLRELFPYINAVTSEVKREDLLGNIADALGVDRQSVITDFRRGGEKSSKPGQPVPTQADTSTSSDLFLMVATVVNRGHFVFVRQMLRPDDLDDPAAREIFIALEECFRREESSLELLLERIETPATRNMLVERLQSEVFNLNPERVIKDSVYGVRRRNLAKKRAEVEAKIRQLTHLSGPNANDALRELLQDKMYLDGELAKLRMMLDDRTAE